MDVIAAADWIIDLGEHAGTKGGQIMFSGTPQVMVEQGNSLTAEYLRQHCKDTRTEEKVV
ncbi:hypothetical protein [Xenorhabdus sp. Sc-CR9]|uniref:hypothetical protein n=1 Tax=Xenorhabdus sp. Sc-CR9 TaxID=2584468 RepID=UPI001F16BAC4|nr:hypothetical protein [Xenorhabdus sp. Sc-CR9]